MWELWYIKIKRCEGLFNELKNCLNYFSYINFFYLFISKNLEWRNCQIVKIKKILMRHKCWKLMRYVAPELFVYSVKMYICVIEFYCLIGESRIEFDRKYLFKKMPNWESCLEVNFHYIEERKCWSWLKRKGDDYGRRTIYFMSKVVKE